MRSEEIIWEAKAGDDAVVTAIFEMYRPLLCKKAIVGGRFDEDLYQELQQTALNRKNSDTKSKYILTQSQKRVILRKIDIVSTI